MFYFFPNPTFIPHFSTYLPTHNDLTYDPTFIPHKISKIIISHINPTIQIKKDVVYFCRRGDTIPFHWVFLPTHYWQLTFLESISKGYVISSIVCCTYIPILNCNCRMRRAIERLRTDAILRAHAKGLRTADRWKDVWQPNIRIWNIYFILNFFLQLGQTFLVQKHHHPQNPLETLQERFW